MVPSIYGENMFDDFFDNSFFGGHSPLFGKHERNLMKTDIHETDDAKAYRFAVELPGFQKDEIHVDVKDGWIVVNGEKAFQPSAAGRYTDKERTFLTAGKLDRLYHTGHVPDAVIQDDTIYCGNTAVYSLSSAEDGKLYVANLNKGIAKDRGEAVQSDFDIDSRRKKIEKKAKAGKQNGGSVENAVQAGAIPEAG